MITPKIWAMADTHLGGPVRRSATMLLINLETWSMLAYTSFMMQYKGRIPRRLRLKSKHSILAWAEENASIWAAGDLMNEKGQNHASNTLP